MAKSSSRPTSSATSPARKPRLAGRTVREVLDNVFADNPQARGYVLDDQSSLRKHMTIFVDGRMIRDRAQLTDRRARGRARIYVFQALSGG